MKRFLLLPILFASSLLGATTDSAVANTQVLMPNEVDNYWSYVGELKYNGNAARVNLRKEVETTSYVDNKRTMLINQEIIPSGADIVEDIEFLNKRFFETTHNGWLVFREEYDSQFLEYKRPAKLLSQEFSQNKSYKYKTTFNPETGNYGVVSYHTIMTGLETVDIPNGSFEALKINQEKRTKIASDEELEDITAVITEYSSNWFVPNIGLVKQDVMITKTGSEGTASTNYEIDLYRTNYLPNYLWPDATESEDGWTFVSWFGYLTDNYFPWIYHSDHGWLFVDAEDSSDIRLWSETLGWWFTSKDLYPTFYSHDLGDWLTYEVDGSEVERSFIRSDGTIVTASNSGFRFRPNSSRPPELSKTADTEKSGDQIFVDEDGNRYVDGDDGIKSDQGELPEVEIIYPLNNTKLREGEQVLVLVDATDKDGKVIWVKISVNGRIIGISENAPYRAIFEPDNQTESYTIEAIARDNYGNETTSTAITLSADITDPEPPKVRIASPMNKSYFKYGEKIRVELKASDPDGFIEDVGLLVDGIQVGDTKKNPPYTFSFTPPIKDNYTIGGFAIDDDGEEAQADSIVITVNDSGVPLSSSSIYGPEIRITRPLNGEVFALGASVSISVTTNSPNDPIERIQIFANGQQIGNSGSGSNHSVTYYPPNGVDGIVNIEAKATSVSGQVASSTISVSIE